MGCHGVYMRMNGLHRAAMGECEEGKKLIFSNEFNHKFLCNYIFVLRVSCHFVDGFG